MDMWTCPNCGRAFRNANQKHNCATTPADIDAYIAAQPEELQPLLQQVRETIRAAAPEALEKISWGMPTFWQGENLIHFAAFQKHLGVYPGDLSLVPFQDRLAGYRCTKGAVQFPFGQPIDHALLADITKWRLACAAKTRAPAAALPRRAVHEMPAFVSAALDETDLWERYRARPPYQRNDYIGWISRAKQEETRRRRLAQMLEELRAGDAYMGMAYHAKEHA